MRTLNLDDLRKLLAAPGLPGREAPVAQCISELLPQAGWTVAVDPVGNLTARKPGAGPRVMFVAHMDEVGLIVRRITSDGFLKVERMGGIHAPLLPGSPMDLWTDRGRLDAHVGAAAAHLSGADDPRPSLADVFIDVGACSKEDVVTMGIQVGDGLTWHSPLCCLGGERIRSKALDDRLGCFALIRLAWLLEETPVDAEVVLAFVTQEEGIFLEAAPAVRQHQPDVVIGVDGTLTFDTPDVDEPQSEIVLGGGPTLKLMDAIRGKTAYFPSWALTRQIRTYLSQKGVHYQPEVVVGLSTALSLVPFMNAGIRTACFSLPIRYHHSPVETADLTDLSELEWILLHILVDRVLC